MKVLVVNTVGMFLNGITKVIMEYYRNMPDIQFDFISITPVSPAIKEELRRRHSNVYVLNRRGNVFTYMFQVESLCRRKKYDVIHVHGNSATMVFDLLPAKMAGVKKRIAHSHNSTCHYKKLHIFLKPILGRLYTDALACSTTAGEWIFGKGNYQILNNAVSIEKYAFHSEIRKMYRKKFHLSDKQIVLGHVGLCNMQKNKKYLLEIMKDLVKEEDAVLFLIGDGDKEIVEELKSKIYEYKLKEQVFLLGMRKDIPQMLQIMDIFLFPSLWEGLGIVLIEAQAAGLPCIASTNVPETANLTENVMYLDLKDKDSWIYEIRKIARNSKQSRKEISQANIRRIRKAGYDICDKAKQLQSLYLGT